MICVKHDHTAVTSNMISIFPPQTGGDIYARYLVRVEEMRESLRIIEQALNKLPYGPVRSNNRKFVPPPRSEIGVSMEALIHHFKLWTEGFQAPAEGRVCRRRIPRGEIGCLYGRRRRPKPYRDSLPHPILCQFADHAVC